jgi:hypothetical protein
MVHFTTLVRGLARLMKTQNAPGKGRYAGKILSVILAVILPVLSMTERPDKSETENRIQNPHSQNNIKVKAKIDIHIDVDTQ